MKILVVKPQGGAFLYITKGFINAFRSIGCEAEFWDGNIQSFKSFNPDLYIGCSGHRQQVPSNYSGKIAIHVNPYGDKLEPFFGVDINEPKNAIEWTVKQNPDVVFGYGLDADGKTYWKNWVNELGIKFVGLPTAGDATLYYPDARNNNYKLAFLGGRWPYKANNIDKWVVPLIRKAGDKIAISGWGGWQGFKQYRGPLPDSDPGRVFLSSANVCPCVCEPHTTRYGIDIPERFFKVALCGSLPILDHIHGFDRYCTNYVMANNPDQYVQLALNYGCNPDYIDQGRELALKIREEVISKHTYHNRMSNLCGALGFEKTVERFKDEIDRLSRQSHS